MWRVSCIENKIKVNKECALKIKEFREKNEYCELEMDDVVENGHLVFNEDHFEHIDYLNENGLIKLLKHFKAKGRTTFGCLDGDQFGEFWGYEFDGKGGFKRLKGSLDWKPTK
jgi:meiotically up-regulated gene 157 (Mug157) protein